MGCRALLTLSVSLPCRRRRPFHLASNHLIPTPSDSRAHQCARYFPGIDMRLMHEWWVYVDEGGSIAAEDVAFAIQYAVMYQ